MFGHIFLQQFALGAQVVFHGTESANRYTLGTADTLVLVDMGLDVIYSDGIGWAMLETFAATCAFIIDGWFECGVLTHLGFSAGTAHTDCFKCGCGAGADMAGEMGDRQDRLATGNVVGNEDFLVHWAIDLYGSL